MHEHGYRMQCRFFSMQEKVFYLNIYVYGLELVVSYNMKLLILPNI